MPNGSDGVLVLLIGDYELKKAKTNSSADARNNLPLAMRVRIHHKSSNSVDGSGLFTGLVVKICLERMTGFLRWRPLTFPRLCQAYILHVCRGTGAPVSGVRSLSEAFLSEFPRVGNQWKATSMEVLSSLIATRQRAHEVSSK